MNVQRKQKKHITHVLVLILAFALLTAAPVYAVGDAVGANIPLTGSWVEIGGNHFYYIGGVRQTGWMNIGARRVFLNPEAGGAMATGVISTTSHGAHEFGLDGFWIRQINNFVWRESGGGHFLYIYGIRHTGWLQSGGRRIFLIPEANGALATGIISTTTHGVHEFTADGFWIRQIHNARWASGYEFFYIGGARHTGWLQAAGRRIFFIPEAASTLATGVVSTAAHGVHEFTADGFWLRQIHNSGWNNGFFYVYGARHTGWLRSGGNRLYLHPSTNGAVSTGTVVLTNGETHVFDANGNWIRRHVPTTTPVPTPPPNQGTFPQSGITLPDRRLTDAERDIWIAEYWAMGGPFSFELEVIQLVNQARLSVGLAYLEMDITLMMAARFYSQIMANLDTDLGHNEGPYRIAGATHGASREVVRAFGGDLRWNGGNAAAGRDTPQGLVGRWMNSPGHRAYILSPEHRFIGVGSHAGGRWNAFQYMFLSNQASN